ncbi:hypothetical protein [Methanolobus sp. WCC5]|uniref:hypothetical protein n=1 Tax=Methanolobus sp. WCC5 TaxID=3125785 RepID=UPI003249E5C7
MELTEEELEQFRERRDTFAPEMYDLNKVLDDTIVGEHAARMSLFTIFILSKICSYVSGPSAGGKTAIMDAVIDTLMPGDGVVVEGGSDKAIFDKEREIKKAKYVEIRELNKVNQLWIEIFKSWGEGKEFIYERAQIQGGNKKFILPPRPFVVSRADESANEHDVGAEFRSRMVEVVVDGSQDQTLSVIDWQAESKEDPFDVKHVDKVFKACVKWHVGHLPEPDIIVNPAATVLTKYIPSVFTTARRDFPKYLANCEGIAKFYHRDRMIVDIKGKKTLFVTPADLFLNHYIFGTAMIASALRCNQLEKQMIQIIEKYGELTKADIQRCLRKYQINVTLRVIDNHLNHLGDLGYLNIDKPKRENVYSVSDFYNEFTVSPDFNEIVEAIKQKMRTNKNYQPFAEEYIKRFCGDGETLMVKDPISGQDINILTYQFDKPHEVQLVGGEQGTGDVDSDYLYTRKPLFLTID